jgi:hypothetical protein
MRLSTNAWLLAVISIPLTIVTIGLWATWVYFTKVTTTPPTPDSEKDHNNSTLPSILRRRQGSFKSILTSRRTRPADSPTTTLPHTSSFASMFSLRKNTTARDLEKGYLVSEKAVGSRTSPPVKFQEVDGTWSSTTTTI